MGTDDHGNLTERSNRHVACDVLRELALHDGVSDELRIQAASLLLHADADSDYSSAMLEIDAIADAVAERIKSQA